MSEPAAPPNMNNITVQMLRLDMANLPVIPFPDGYGIRPMRLIDAGLWEDIWRDTERFWEVKAGLFETEFGNDAAKIAQRCFLVTNPRGCAVGTISAWNAADFRTGDWGRIHWVATRPSEQGKGLAKASMSYAMAQLAQWHTQTLLGTSTGRIGAVKIYLDFGFIPDMDMPWAKEAWTSVKSKLNHPALAAM